MPNKECYAQQYAEYSKTLRNWLIVYGVGGIGVVIVEKDCFAKPDTGDRQLIILFFAVAVFSQIIISVLNKWYNWKIYSDLLKKEEEKNTERHQEIYKKRVHSYDRWFFVFNIISDIIAFLCFLIATILVYEAL